MAGAKGATIKLKQMFFLLCTFIKEARVSTEPLKNNTWAEQLVLSLKTILQSQEEFTLYQFPAQGVATSRPHASPG